LTGSQEAEDIRERVYKLYLKRLNVREIAKTMGLPKSNVAYHLSIIRKQNVAWFDKNMDPEGRRRAFVKELVDQTGDVVRESWTLYGKALTRLNDMLKTDKNPVRAFGVCNSYIRTIIKSLQQYRLCVQVVAPSMDDVWLHDKMDEVMKQHGEIRKMMKDSGFLPIKSSKDIGKNVARKSKTRDSAELGYSA
jgi:recombinational DNA repair ATPase RecF